MSPEWATAIGTIGTFVVISASAIAALMQLRHMRSGNQIAAYNELRETMDAPEFRNALHFIRTELAQRLTEPRAADELVAQSLPGEYAAIRILGNLFESMGLFVRLGMMERGIACELWAGIVLDTWNRLRPLIVAARRQNGEGVWINFEYMAALSQDYMSKGLGLQYPADAMRMPLDAR